MTDTQPSESPEPPSMSSPENSTPSPLSSSNSGIINSLISKMRKRLLLKMRRTIEKKVVGEGIYESSKRKRIELGHGILSKKKRKINEGTARTYLKRKSWISSKTKKKKSNYVRLLSKRKRNDVEDDEEEDVNLSKRRYGYHFYLPRLHFQEDESYLPRLLFGDDGEDKSETEEEDKSETKEEEEEINRKPRRRRRRINRKPMRRRKRGINRKPRRRTLFELVMRLIYQTLFSPQTGTISSLATRIKDYFETWSWKAPVANLRDLYTKLQPKGDFEIVFVAVTNEHPISSFTRRNLQHIIYMMPCCPAIPLSDQTSIQRLERMFGIRQYLFVVSMTRWLVYIFVHV